LNAEDAGIIAMEFNFEAIIDRSETEDLKAREPAQDTSSLPPRPPVVTIMGHVDHGKTTLLDWLRKSSVAATEHGGITQHIGAFSVQMPSGKTITFLDTPGHAAFLSMRQRGANVTDIVILVVAADDSVKPQTIEAINHAKAAKVPIIVAINKVDKPEINIDRVKQDLARYGVEIEDFGGDTQVVCVSGKTGQGMDKLEEAALTLSEIQDMRAERDGPAEGWVLEASIKSMGKVATVLVRRGTVRPGDFIVAGNTWARIRCLRNEAGIEIEEAGPGMPVEIDGWREQPVAGDEVLQAPDEGKAKSVVDYRLEKIERDKMAEDMEAVNVNRKVDQERREKEKEEARLAKQREDDEEDAAPKEEKPSGTKAVYFIVKGDVSGSVEAVIDSISQIGNKEVEPKILRAGVGQLSEFDVEHAAVAKGFLINFNTPIDPHIARLADQSKVGILDHNVIYRLVDDVKAELSKQLPPLITQRVTGEAEIAQVFSIKIKKREVKNIAGCRVRNGVIARNSKVRVLRDNEKIFDGMCFPLFLFLCLFPSTDFQTNVVGLD
jgi:translation initiation factor IF-2